MQNLSEFKKQKGYLVCVDSDGCAMDTMDIKHFKCFGPCMVKEWCLTEWETEILRRWNEINLYSLTRGINRFKGLALALSEINEKYTAIDGVDDLVFWAENSDELSNAALARAISEHPEKIVLKKAISWSEAVNKSIKALPESDLKPFENVLDALKFAHEHADVAVVSSANLGAVLEEWSRSGLLEHTDIVLTQNAGSKAFCIGELIKKGYNKEKILMCGDAPGDKKAAEQNGVNFYPILVKKEKESWQEFINDGFKKLLDGEYVGQYQERKSREFIENLSK